MYTNEVLKCPYHRLEIKDLSLAVRLGCSEEERRLPQEVRVSVDLDFNSQPEGCLSDNLKDTVCYSKICDIISKHEAHEFRLIEHLAHRIYTELKAFIGGQCLVHIRLHKIQPPVKNLLGGSVYSCGDSPLSTP